MTGRKRSIWIFLGAGICAFASSPAFPLNADEVFSEVEGDWCRLDQRAGFKTVYDVPDSMSGILTGAMTSRAFKVEMEGEFVEMKEEGNDITLTFTSSSRNTRAADGSTVTSRFTQTLIFDSQFAAMRTVGRNGLASFFSRCVFLPPEETAAPEGADGEPKPDTP